MRTVRKSLWQGPRQRDSLRPTVWLQSRVSHDSNSRHFPFLLMSLFLASSARSLGWQVGRLNGQTKAGGCIKRCNSGSWVGCCLDKQHLVQIPQLTRLLLIKGCAEPRMSQQCSQGSALRERRSDAYSRKDSAHQLSQLLQMPHNYEKS